jgi:hypothetical protein
VNVEKTDKKIGKWFIVLVAAGMIALATWGSYKAVCVPDISAASLQGDSSSISIQNNAVAPDSAGGVYIVAG